MATFVPSRLRWRLAEMKPGARRTTAVAWSSKSRSCRCCAGSTVKTLMSVTNLSCVKIVVIRRWTPAISSYFGQNSTLMDQCPDLSWLAHHPAFRCALRRICLLIYCKAGCPREPRRRRAFNPAGEAGPTSVDLRVTPAKRIALEFLREVHFHALHPEIGIERLSGEPTGDN